MKVKGFIFEDSKGRECVMVYEQLSNRSGKMFALRGWQRRRLVPLRYTKEEYWGIVAQVLLTLDDLFARLPSVCADMDGFDKTAEGARLLKATVKERHRVMN